MEGTNNNKYFENGILIEGMVLGYVAWYKKHYCIVSINSKTAVIKDEEGIDVINIKAEKGQFIDVQAFNKLVADIVIKYIEEKYIEKEEILFEPEITNGLNKEEEIEILDMEDDK